jgi:hypothetical protein
VAGSDAGETVGLLGRTLADDPPNLILLETLSVLSPSLFGVVEALVGLRIPVWLWFRRCRHGLCGVYGQHWGGPEGDGFGRAARRFEELRVAALLANCIPPDHVEVIVSYLRDFTDMPLGAYPNLGHYTSGGWRFETEIGDAEYGELARRWRAEVAPIVGGCCGTGPVHVAAAAAALVDTRPGRGRREPRRESRLIRATNNGNLAAGESLAHLPGFSVAGATNPSSTRCGRRPSRGPGLGDRGRPGDRRSRRALAERILTPS